MRHYETCSCDSRIEVRSWSHRSAHEAINAWRERHATCKPAPDEEPQPAGDTYASTERAGYHHGPSIGFEPNMPQGAKA